VNFSDMHATFLELAGAKAPEGLKFDSISIAPQLRGEQGTPREWAYVQLGAKWYVREQGWKLNESGELFDMSDAPFVEKLVESASDTETSKAARTRLTAVLAELNPAGGKNDSNDKGGKPGKKKKKKKMQQE
jgi:arylsulfatase A